MTEVADNLIGTNEHPIQLPVFEGPLDLLLFLIRKNEIEIYDIPIATVTEQYLAVLHSMERLNLEVAGDFFVMAATLMHIKSRMLLPKDEQAAAEEDDPEDADPRWELVQQLIEYRKFKEAAINLDQLIREAQDYLSRNTAVDPVDLEPRPLRPVDRIELWNVFNQVLRRLAEKMTVGEIHGEIITVADRMEFLLAHLRDNARFTFSGLFTNRPYSIGMLVATFLAILELTRLNHVTLQQDGHHTDILIEAIPAQ